MNWHLKLVCCLGIISVAMCFSQGMAEPYVMLSPEQCFANGRVQAVAVAKFSGAKDAASGLPRASFRVQERMWGKGVPDTLKLNIDLGQGCEAPLGVTAVNKRLKDGTMWILLLSKNEHGFFLDYQMRGRGRFPATGDNLVIIRKFLASGKKGSLDQLH